MSEEPFYQAAVTDSHFKEFEMGNNKDPDKTRPGEMPPGNFHYNPGNMSGKSIGNAKRHKDDVAVPLDQEETDRKKSLTPRCISIPKD
jgi:hypothetical protein